MVVLPNSTRELEPSDDRDTVSLKVEFYVKLPDRVNLSPNRATNYVVPRATLKQIVREDNDVIGAVVRNSVAPSLTEQVLNSWWVVAIVFIVVLSVAIAAAMATVLGYAAYKYWQRYVFMSSALEYKLVKVKASKCTYTHNDYPKATF